MRINFQKGAYSDRDAATPTCRFVFYVTMPEAIETQEEAARWILCQLGKLVTDFKHSLPGAEIWVDGKQLPREAEKGGGKA